jgi:hypothetical protein
LVSRIEMSKSKSKLNEAVRDRLDSLSLTQKEFAHKNLIDHNVLRVQLTRNVYSAKVLAAAAELLCGGNKSQLKKLYDFRETTRTRESIVLPTQTLKESVGRTIKPRHAATLTHDIELLYAGLRASDLVVICTFDLPPLECTAPGWERLKNPLVNAVAAGTQFVYIRPTATVISQQSKMLPECFTNRTPLEEFEDLRKNLRKSVGSNQKAASNVTANVHLLQVDQCPFWAIGMRFGFYSVASEVTEKRDMTLFARFPFGGRFSGDETVDSKLLLFADERTKDAFQSYLIRQFEESQLEKLIGRLI